MKQYRMEKDLCVVMLVASSVLLSVIIFSHDYHTFNGVVGLVALIGWLIIFPILSMWTVAIDEIGLASGYCFFGRFKKTVQIDFEDIESVCIGADKKSVFVYSASKRSWLTGRAAIVLKENLINRSELLGLLLEKVPASKVVDAAVYEKASGMKL